MTAQRRGLNQMSRVIPSGTSHTVMDPCGISVTADACDLVPEKDEELARAVAKVLVFGFGGTSIDSHARRLIAKGAGGVIFFRRNIKDVLQVARLCSELKVEAGRELLTMVDQEGGLVARLGPPFTRIPPARVVGSTGDTQAASAVGFILGRELRAVGIDMNLAPVLDVDTNPENPVIGTRAFGRSPDLVAGMGCALIRAMQREGVAACPKHFPGHGDTAADSHHELPVLEHSISRLLEVELPPFAKAVEADAAAVMIAHVVVPAMEDQQQKPRPASMSRSVVSYLREQLHFEGLILSDCLEMGAILNNFSVGEAAVEAVTAGVDMVLVSKHEHLQLAVIDALTRAVKEGKLPYRRIMEAGQRIAAVTRQFAPPEATRNTLLERGFHESRLGVIGCREHQDMVANIECQATALDSQCS